MKVRTGISSDTPDRIIIDAGAVYLNYGLAGERLLGATRGGNEFNLNRVIKNIEADGLKGSVRGMKRVTEVNPQITANLIELTVANLVAAIAGANQSDQVNVPTESIGPGTGTEKEFSLAHDDVIVNSERIYVEDATGVMILQTRSKKYASRFVGDNRINNKRFDTDLGDWVKMGTGGGISHVADGQSGNCLKYTGTAEQGGTEYEFLKLAGETSAVLTALEDGKHYRFQIALKRVGTWTPETNKVTVKCGDTSLSKEITLTTDWVVYVFEFEASGTTVDIILTTTATAPVEGDVLCIDSLELEEVDYPSGDEQTAGQFGYVMNWIEGTVVFAIAPTNLRDITASYTYVPSAAGVAVDTTITGGEIEDVDYIDNVAIVGNVSGKTYPIICIVKNALADAGFSISTAPRDEAVPAIVFTGHYDPDDLDAEPWEIRWPKS